jgi:hypothetical protein
MSESLDALAKAIQGREDGRNWDDLSASGQAYWLIQANAALRFLFGDAYEDGMEVEEGCVGDAIDLLNRLSVLSDNAFTIRVNIDCALRLLRGEEGGASD